MNTFYLAATLTSTVRPIFGQWSPLIVWTIQIAFVVAFALCVRLSAMVTDDLERQIGEAVGATLETIKLPIKSAAVLMTMDENHLRQALKFDTGRHLSLYKLARLPLLFWTVFLPTLSYIVVRQHMTEIVEDARTLRRIS